MDDMTIEQFCDLHFACREDREWAMENCQTMQEVWKTAKPLWLMWVATRPGVLSDRELRLYAAARLRRYAGSPTAVLGFPSLAGDEYAAWVAAGAGYAACWLRTNCTPRFAQVAGKEEVTL
jgi:hypothetical protein